MTASNEASDLVLAVVGQALINRDLRADDSEEFRSVVSLLRGADAAFTNFEGTIEGRHGGWPTKEAFVHTGKPIVLDCLKDMGFRLLSLANNHAFDLGSAGILSTLEAARERGFACAGTGADRNTAALPGFLETPKGRVGLVAMDCSPLPDAVYALDAAAHRPARPGVNRQRVFPSLRVDAQAFARLKAISAAAGNEKRKSGRVQVGYQEADSTGVLDFYGARVERSDRLAEGRRLDGDDRAKNLAAVRAAASEARLTLAYVHHHFWEPDWESTPEWIEELAHDCIDAGAGAFVSHGVPLLQAIEIYKGRPIFYGLGNFVFHTHRAPRYTDDRIWQSVVALCRFGPDGALAEIRLLPIALGGEAALADRSFTVPRDAPKRLGPDMANAVLLRLRHLSRPYGTEIAIEGGEGRIVRA